MWAGGCTRHECGGRIMLYIHAFELQANRWYAGVTGLSSSTFMGSIFAGAFDSTGQ